MTSSGEPNVYRATSPGEVLLEDESIVDETKPVWAFTYSPRKSDPLREHDNLQGTPATLASTVDGHASSSMASTAEHERVKTESAIVLRTVNGRFFCSEVGCEATFLRIRDCRRHLKKHNGPYFPCNQYGCDMKFWRQGKLRNHMRQGHGIFIGAPARGARGGGGITQRRGEPTHPLLPCSPCKLDNYLFPGTPELNGRTSDTAVNLSSPQEYQATVSSFAKEVNSIKENSGSVEVKSQNPPTSPHGVHFEHMVEGGPRLSAEIDTVEHVTLSEVSALLAEVEEGGAKTPELLDTRASSSDEWKEKREKYGDVLSEATWGEYILEPTPKGRDIHTETEQQAETTDRFDTTTQRLEQGEGSWSESGASIYTASIFSSESLESDATDLSQGSGYSATQIDTTTKVLLEMFQEVRKLDLLYKRAKTFPAMGPDRPQSNLHRLFKSYDRNLDEEHEERLEFLASRLMAMRARYLAKSIVDNVRHSHKRLKCDLPMLNNSDEESTDNEPETRSVRDKDSEDLKNFQRFLIDSMVFMTLRAQIQFFVIPKSSESTRTTLHVEAPSSVETTGFSKASNWEKPKSGTWKMWGRDLAKTLDLVLGQRDFELARRLAKQLALEALSLATDRAFIAMGTLEPALSPGLTRLRWTCKCGDRLFSDVKELEDGGIDELTARMENTSRIKVVSASYNEHSGNQRYNVPRHFRWFGGGSGACQTNQQCPIRFSFSFLFSFFFSNTSADSTSTAFGQSSQGSVQNTPMLHLMACVHNKRFSKILLQDRIEHITTDYALIEFLRTQYRQHRGRIRSILSLKCVQGIYFIGFDLPMGKSVIIRPHEVSCLATPSNAICNCLPPITRVEPHDKAEYQCQPVPPKVFPPVPPEYLLSLFTCEEEPNYMSRWIVEQLPKRKWGELFGKPGQPADGWGIYYKEGWDSRRIAFAVFLLLSVSLFFSVLWTTLRHDVQGAFSVGAWIVSIGGAALAVIAL